MKKIFVMLLLSAVTLSGCGSHASASQPTEQNVEQNVEKAMAAEEENASQSSEEAEELKDEYRVEEIEIDDSGSKIYGRMYYPKEEKDTYPTVIMSHGIGGNYKNCEPYAMRFAANGIAAFAFDFQGGGPESKSEGEMKDMSTLTEAQDLECVTEYIKSMETVDKDNLFLLGESQGGFVSAYAAAKAPADYKAIVLYYPAFVLQDDAWKKYPDGPETALDLEVIYGIEVGKKSYIDNMSFDIYDMIGDYNKDVLIVHGEDDPVVPLSYSERAVKTYKSAELKTIPKAEHGFKGNDIDTAAQYAIEFVKEHIN
ncbi:MAG: alpha/beta fold hydrolase [Lachnospiraceae bacterium]|nr:alpha/beta fold hydrolase [Lachnospiraceae bacterium]